MSTGTVETVSLLLPVLPDRTPTAAVDLWWRVLSPANGDTPGAPALRCDRAEWIVGPPDSSVSVVERLEGPTRVALLRDGVRCTTDVSTGPLAGSSGAGARLPARALTWVSLMLHYGHPTSESRRRLPRVPVYGMPKLVAAEFNLGALVGGHPVELRTSIDSAHQRTEQFLLGEVSTWARRLLRSRDRHVDLDEALKVRDRSGTDAEWRRELRVDLPGAVAVGRLADPVLKLERSPFTVRWRSAH